MAACAMVATTDGKVSFAENVRFDQILQTLNLLKVFDPHEGVDVFCVFCESIPENPETGHVEAREAIAKITSNAEDGALLLRVCSCQ
jgi:tellurite resistance protein TerB